MALVEARKEGRLGGYSMGDRNFCNAYRNFCRPKCAYQMVRSAAASLFWLLVVRQRHFTFSAKKLTFLTQCATPRAWFSVLCCCGSRAVRRGQ